MRHDPVARPQSRRQRAADTDADEAAHAGREPVERRFQPRMIATAGHDFDARAGENALLALEPGGDEDRHIP